MPIGTIVNTVAVIVGSLLGLLLHENLPEKIKTIVFQALGLCTLVIGMQMALKAQNLLVLIFSLLIGGIIGEFINLDGLVERLSNFFKTKIKSKDEKFTEGLVTAFLIFCVGSMTIVGAINEGLKADRTLLYTKSILDGFTSIALASTFGVGVLFSAIPLLIFQGGITLLALQFQHFFSTAIIAQLTATGGVLILGIGFNMLDIKKIKVTNLLPALIVVALLTLLIK